MQYLGADPLSDLERIAKRLDRSERKRAEIIAERDRLIRLALSQGESLRVIGAAAGLSHGAIALIRDASP